MHESILLLIVIAALAINLGVLYSSINKIKKQQKKHLEMIHKINGSISMINATFNAMLSKD